MAERPASPSRILVGSDGSERAGRAVARAVQVAGALDASVTILGVGDERKLRPRLEAQARANAGDDVDIETRIVSGNPVTALIDAAREGGYDLLVVGNKGMTGLERLRLGAVPNKLSHHIPCSMLIVRTG